MYVHQLAPNPAMCFGVDGHSKFKGEIDTAVFFSEDTYLSTKNVPKIEFNLRCAKDYLPKSWSDKSIYNSMHQKKD